MSNRTRPDIELHVIFNDQPVTLVPLWLSLETDDPSSEPVQFTMRLFGSAQSLKEIRDNDEAIDFIFLVKGQTVTNPKRPRVITGGRCTELHSFSMYNRAKPDIELRVIFNNRPITVIPLYLPLDTDNPSGEPVQFTMRLVGSAKRLKEIRDNGEVIDLMFPVTEEMVINPKRPRVPTGPVTTTVYDAKGRMISRQESVGS